MRCRPSRRTTIMRRSSCSTRLAEPGRKGGRKPYGTPDEGMGASEPPRPPPPPPRPPGPRPPRPPPRPPDRPPDRPPEPLPDDISKLQYECAKVPPFVLWRVASSLSSHQHRCVLRAVRCRCKINALSVDSLPSAAAHSSSRPDQLWAGKHVDDYSFAKPSYHLIN